MNNRLTKTQYLLIAFCLAAIAAINRLDILTGEEYELFVLYFIPVSMIAWWIGRAAGILASFASALAWLESDAFSHTIYSWPIGTWDELMRLASFLFVALLLSKVRDDLNRERRLNSDLEQALAEIKVLRGIIPMCSVCRKIRDERQHWVAVDRYITDHTDAQVSHGLCPSCYRKTYGDPDGT